MIPEYETFTAYKRDMKGVVTKLSPEDIKRLHSEGEYDTLVESFLPMVLHVAMKTQPKSGIGVEYMDLVQAGNIGLINAVRSWNPDHASGLALSTWAWRYIKRDMMRELESTPVMDSLEMPGYVVTTDEIHAEDEAQPETGGGYSLKTSQKEAIPAPAVSPEDAVNTYQEKREARALVDILQQTHPKQAQAVRLVYFEGLSQAEAGRIMDVSQQAIFKLLSAAVVNLQKGRQ
jgi:RNA polymerase sigma factor (sigma-70 family)